MCWQGVRKEGVRLACCEAGKRPRICARTTQQQLRPHDIDPLHGWHARRPLAARRGAPTDPGPPETTLQARSAIGQQVLMQGPACMLQLIKDVEDGKYKDAFPDIAKLRVSLRPIRGAVVPILDSKADAALGERLPAHEMRYTPPDPEVCPSLSSLSHILCST